jgi:hypothetical protein
MISDFHDIPPAPLAQPDDAAFEEIESKYRRRELAMSALLDRFLSRRSASWLHHIYDQRARIYGY